MKASISIISTLVLFVGITQAIDCEDPFVSRKANKDSVNEECLCPKFQK